MANPNEAAGGQVGKVLLTGPPGCGKTTVILRTLERLHGLTCRGFYTQEMRVHGRRTGFEAVGLSGGRALLANVDSSSRHRVGRYGVELDAFERLLRRELEAPATRSANLLVIDEIGKMECFSPVFQQLTLEALDAPAPLLATVALRGRGLIAQVKQRKDTRLVHVSKAVREALPDKLARQLLSAAASVRRKPQSL